MGIGERWQQELLNPPYTLPMHKNCRCVWWRTEYWPEREEVSRVVSEWTNNFEPLRKWFGNDIETTKAVLVDAMKNEFGWNLVYTIESAAVAI